MLGLVIIAGWAQRCPGCQLASSRVRDSSPFRSKQLDPFQVLRGSAVRFTFFLIKKKEKTFVCCTPDSLLIGSILLLEYSQKKMQPEAAFCHETGHFHFFLSATSAGFFSQTTPQSHTRPMDCHWHLRAPQLALASLDLGLVPILMYHTSRFCLGREPYPNLRACGVRAYSNCIFRVNMRIPA